MMQDRKERYALGGLILIYTVLFGLFASARHYRMETSIFDLGIFDQALYLLAKGDTHYLSTRGLHIHGDHFHPILNLLAPLYLLGMSEVGLLFVQSFIVALGTIPVFYLARHHGIAPLWSFNFALAYLAHPTVSFLNRFDFHPVVIMLPALLASVLFLEKGWPRAYALALLLTLSCTEATGFTIIALSATAFLLRGLRWAVGTLAFGVGGMVIAKISLKYFLNGNPTAYAALYTDYGTSESQIIKNVFLHPIATASALSTKTNLEYLLYILASLLFLPLISPVRLLPIVPTLMGNLLSWRLSQHKVEFHYGAAIAPFLLWSAIYSWKKLTKGDRKRELVLGALLFVGTFIAVWRGPTGEVHTKRIKQPIDFHSVSERIQIDDSVSSDSGIGPHLTGRDELYLFPSPFVPVAWGSSVDALIHQSSAEYPPIGSAQLRRGIESTSVTWVVLPKSVDRRRTFPNRAEDDAYLRQQLIRSKLYEQIPTEDDFMLFRRKESP